MVVDCSQAIAPLFWYVYQNKVRTGHVDDNQAVSGFNVALYPDNRLLCTRFNGVGGQEAYTFALQGDVVGRYMQILAGQSWWLENLPLETLPDVPASAVSIFGFADYPLFICEDMDILAQEPFNSRRGMIARRLRGMLECMSELFYQSGILLCVDDMTWNWGATRPEEQVSVPQMAPQNWQQAM